MYGSYYKMNREQKGRRERVVLCNQIIPLMTRSNQHGWKGHLRDNNGHLKGPANEFQSVWRTLVNCFIHIVLTLLTFTLKLKTNTVIHLYRFGKVFSLFSGHLNVFGLLEVPTIVSNLHGKTFELN